MNGQAAMSGGVDPTRPMPVLPLVLLIGALTFNMALCFINTNVMGINDTMVMGCEVVLVATALYLGLGRNAAPYLLLAVFISYAAMLMAMRPLLDPKAVRDFLIPVAFYLLGKSCNDPRVADRAALISGIIVVVFGLFEFLALDLYVTYFNIIKYYVARGTVAPSDVSSQTGALFASGLRPDSRTLLPFLGPHRASSVFLEPISTGNFGAILYIWALNRPQMAKRWLTMAAGMTAIVLSDSRFGANVCIVATVAYLVAPITPRFVWLAAPFVMLIGFAIYGFVSAEVNWQNNFAGRMLWTSRLITSLSPAAVFGLSPDKPFLSDSGYAYSLNQIGLFGVIGFWSLFIFAPEKSPRAWRFKVCVATYICLLMIVSDSVYSIKTAALLWFMTGSSDGDAGPEPVPAAQRSMASNYSATATG
ncbi:MAG: UDP-phosphate alpha N-acetylglucosaminyltransferase [Bosea sp.]|uniref:UDP-phosphate alpha N-acetylglucosaminyltransferase n=1 Tax=Bosea sp. (in: a-proteobacteria) TaxID=1871050 RepID=UPI0023A0AF9A|nr:UDP-phosphate alpha N-acetylglucosaminyltransferase [Bosea sp. (in: a-proteobacteria)]MCP4733932.1 UDP-phosphate alpha N-acetylglucosaminyltransferase [Bosea sp. (in: a-proteobacteria)]